MKAIRILTRPFSLKGDFAFAYNNRGLPTLTPRNTPRDRRLQQGRHAPSNDADTFNNRGIAWFNKNEIGKALVDSIRIEY